MRIPVRFVDLTHRAALGAGAMLVLVALMAADTRLPGALVTGGAASGSAVSGNPVLVAGTDGTDARSLLADTSGRVEVVGAAADGANVAGNPVLIGVYDGTHAQSAAGSTSGYQYVDGPNGNGVAATANGILIGGEDGSFNFRTLFTDTFGRPNVMGSEADNVALAGNFMSLAGVAKADAAALTAHTAGRAAALPTGPDGRLLVRTYHPNFFSCIESGITATTQCAAASGASVSYYITDFYFSNGATQQNVSITSGTGTNCGTGTATVTPLEFLAINTDGAHHTLQTPIKLAANVELCCATSGTTAFSCMVSGFKAP